MTDQLQNQTDQLLKALETLHQDNFILGMVLLAIGLVLIAQLFLKR
jgi:hypothetical protein